MCKTGILNKEQSFFESTAHSNAIFAFSRRNFGNMSLSYGDTTRSLDNRKAFLESLKISLNQIICAKQIHGAGVRYIDTTDLGSGALTYGSAIADTDAFITDKVNLALTILTADCLSVFLHDPVTKAIGLVHAGWRSTSANIAARTIELMQDKFGTIPANLCVGFGPAIRECCYIVKQELKDIFPENLILKDNIWYLDLAGVNRIQAIRAGVKEHNIFDSRICTSCCNKEFFSYRREGDSSGRMMSVAMLRSC